MKNKNLRLILAAGLIFIIFMVFAYFVTDSLFQNNPFTNNGRQIRGETGLDLDTNPTLIKQVEESSDVMSLLDKVPHYGENFAFFYNYDQNFFILYVNPNNQTAGNAEFDNFLKENGIEDKGSIYDLREVSVMPTPES